MRLRSYVQLGQCRQSRERRNAGVADLRLAQVEMFKPRQSRDSLNAQIRYAIAAKREYGQVREVLKLLEPLVSHSCLVET